MATWQPDPSFYPSPRQAAKEPAETLAYVAAFDPARKTPDAIAVVDVDPASSSHGKIVNTVTVANAGDDSVGPVADGRGNEKENPRERPRPRELRRNAQ